MSMLSPVDVTIKTPTLLKKYPIQIIQHIVLSMSMHIILRLDRFTAKLVGGGPGPPNN